MKELIINWDGNISLFQEEYPHIIVVSIPEMLDNTYTFLFSNDFKEEGAYMQANGKVDIIGAWDANGMRVGSFSSEKYNKYLREIWNSDTEEYEPAPKNKKVMHILGTFDREI